MRVLGCMSVGGAVTTQSSPAFLARAQMNPAITSLDALLADVSPGVSYIGDAAEMETSRAFHVSNPRLSQCAEGTRATSEDNPTKVSTDSGGCCA
jgi:hypothetical protein